MAGDVTRLYRVRYQVVDLASAPLAKIGRAFVGINLEVDSAIGQTAMFGKELAGLKGQVAGLNAVDMAMKRMTGSTRGLGVEVTGLTGDLSKAGQALRTYAGFQRLLKSNFEGINEEMFKLAAGQRTFQGFMKAIEGAQRKAYGLKMNLEEANLALNGLVVTGSQLSSVAGGIGGVGSATAGATSQTKGLTAGMGGFLAKMVGFSVAVTAAHAFGDGMREAREQAEKSAETVLKLRDGLRELANLQGKGVVDNATLARTVEIRRASGMSDVEAATFQKQFRGSFPLAEKKGNIDLKTGNLIATEVARTATRVGLSAHTAGDLAGSIGSFGKINSHVQGVGQIQQIIDQLNDGRGDLTPLVKELMKGGFSTVGQGNAFHSISERAAGLRVTTGIVGNAGQASTAMGAAIRGLTGFSKAQGETLSAYGVKSGQDLPTMLEKIAPLIENAEKRGANASAALADAGFGNKTDRDAIIGLVKNRAVFRTAIDEVREEDGSDAKAVKAGKRAYALNREFYSEDKGAQNRVAEANLTGATVLRGLETEDLTIARKNARADLVREKKLDTPLANANIKVRNLLAVSPISGADYEQDLVDARVRENAERSAKRVGVNYQRAGFSFDAGTKTQEELRLNSAAIRKEGGNPLGDSAELGKKLDRIAEAVEKQNEAKEQARPLPGGGKGVGPWRN